MVDLLLRPGFKVAAMQITKQPFLPVLPTYFPRVGIQSFFLILNSETF